MAVSVTMPRLGESVSEGTVTRWLKKEGERVEADEPLLEVSTDKVDTEIPSPAAGVLQAIRVGEDETVEVGSELAVIDDGSDGGGGQAADSQAGGEEAPSEQADNHAAEPEPEREPEPEAEPAGTKPPAQRDASLEASPASTSGSKGEGSSAPAIAEPEGGSTYVTPLVRKLAQEHGVDLSRISGTGVGGRVRKQDVLDAAAADGGRARGGADGGGREKQPDRQPSAKPAVTAAQPTRATAPATVRGRTEQMSRLRQVIAERMVTSLQTSAQLTTVVEADLSRIARLRDAAKADFEAREGVRLSFLPFFALATCEALREHPAVNASIEGNEVTYHDTVDLGVAVDTDRGLLVPVVKEASDLNLSGLARKIADLAARTRGNRITPDELGGGTFTLTNTGSRGALFDTPIINQPQVGILGTGAVVKRPVVVDDPAVGEVIAVRHMAYLAMTYDHRLVDGADAARFLTTVKSRLEAGDFEAELGL
jgi:2-oxoglutarate dehydrogenase E2 component (dihydrolipoamide succinyltransferase)